MNPEDVGKILDEIGSRIGPAGQYAWTVAVSYKRVEAIAGLALLGFGILLGLTMTIIGARKAVFTDSGPTAHDIITITGAMILFLSLFVTSLAAGTLIPQAFVPEGAVLNDILNALP